MTTEVPNLYVILFHELAEALKHIFSFVTLVKHECSKSFNRHLLCLPISSTTTSQIINDRYLVFLH